MKGTKRGILLLTVVGITQLMAGLAHAQGARNTIILIGDGMGHTQKQTAAYLAGKPLNMDTLPIVGAMSNYAADNIATDSAAAATALATGYKTNNGMLGVTRDKKAKPSILERARDAGKATGLVATSTISHATPAGFGSHVSGRGDEAEIVEQYLGQNIDLMLGGGMQYFLPKEQGGARADKLNVFEGFMAKGYAFAGDADSLRAIGNLPLLGIFAHDAMAPELDREVTKEPSLAEMTAKAVELLSRDKDGFFLMVEGSQIDWGCHDNDPGYAMTDLLAFDQAVAVALDFSARNPDTLVVVTADHETGGLVLAKGDASTSKLKYVNGQNATVKFIAAALANEKDPAAFKEAFKGYTGATLKDSDVKNLIAAKDKKPLIAKILSTRTGFTWAAGDHSAAPVPVMAKGPGQELFSGWYDNTDLPKRVATAMGLTL